jgi:hypothetical protein
MFVLQVLNDGNEWELIDKMFSTEELAVEFFNTELSYCFDTYEITETVYYGA